MKILITGGLGFIGSHLERELLKLGHSVHIMDRLRVSRSNYHRGDICDYIRMQEIFEEVLPDITYHFGGMVSRKECEETPQMAILTNVTGTLNVVNLCQKYGSKIIYAGSSEEYGTAFDNGQIVTEDTPLGIPTSIYSMTKRMADELVDYYAEFKGVPAVRFRFFMFYGDGEPATEYRSAITRFIDAARKGEDITVHSGTERSWCYIDDGIEALVKSLNIIGGLFNIGRDEPVDTLALANIICEMTNSNSKIKVIQPEKTIIPIKRASFERAKRELNWEAKISLREGLNRIIHKSQS
jgi:nucleoside-diphosphate-sugar epimerase